MTHSDLLRRVYDEAVTIVSSGGAPGNLDAGAGDCVDRIVARSESNKGMLAVLTTLLAHKAVAPGQDIRRHQANMPDGFAGRGIDRHDVTPFMKSVSFPAMAESGWLTRSFEQPHPYTLDYPGKITPKEIKADFLSLVDKVQTRSVDPESVLLRLFVLLVRRRESMNVELAKPHSLSIAAIMDLLEKHFTAKYPCAGASRLPALAVYAAYRCMMPQVARYRGKILRPLESHNSSDARSGRIGDIDVNNEDGAAFEGVEIKHEIMLTAGMAADAYEKFKIHNTDRYYLLTTGNMERADWSPINAEIRRIAQIHGCQVIVNGVYSTLKYYLRLLADTAEFVDRYVECMKTDETIKFQHKTMWNDIVSGDCLQ